jgi:hypothetical protein
MQSPPRRTEILVRLGGIPHLGAGRGTRLARYPSLPRFAEGRDFR